MARSLPLALRHPHADARHTLNVTWLTDKEPDKRLDDEWTAVTALRLSPLRQRQAVVQEETGKC